MSSRSVATLMQRSALTATEAAAGAASSAPLAALASCAAASRADGYLASAASLAAMGLATTAATRYATLTATFPLPLPWAQVLVPTICSAAPPSSMIGAADVPSSTTALISSGPTMAAAAGIFSWRARAAFPHPVRAASMGVRSFSATSTHQAVDAGTPQDEAVGAGTPQDEAAGTAQEEHGDVSSDERLKALQQQAPETVPSFLTIGQIITSSDYTDAEIKYLLTLLSEKLPKQVHGDNIDEKLTSIAKLLDSHSNQIRELQQATSPPTIEPPVASNDNSSKSSSTSDKTPKKKPDEWFIINIRGRKLDLVKIGSFIFQIFRQQ